MGVAGHLRLNAARIQPSNCTRYPYRATATQSYGRRCPGCPGCPDICTPPTSSSPSSSPSLSSSLSSATSSSVPAQIVYFHYNPRHVRKDMPDTTHPPNHTRNSHYQVPLHIATLYISTVRHAIKLLLPANPFTRHPHVLIHVQSRAQNAIRQHTIPVPLPFPCRAFICCTRLWSRRRNAQCARNTYRDNTGFRDRCVMNSLGLAQISTC